MVHLLNTDLLSVTSLNLTKVTLTPFLYSLNSLYLPEIDPPIFKIHK